MSGPSASCVTMRFRNLRQLCRLFLHKTIRVILFSSQPVAHLILTLEVMNAERNCEAKIKARETRQLSVSELVRRPFLFYLAGAKFLGRCFLSITFQSSRVLTSRFSEETEVHTATVLINA